MCMPMVDNHWCRHWVSPKGHVTPPVTTPTALPHCYSMLETTPSSVLGYTQSLQQPQHASIPFSPSKHFSHCSNFNAYHTQPRLQRYKSRRILCPACPCPLLYSTSLSFAMYVPFFCSPRYVIPQVTLLSSLLSNLCNFISNVLYIYDLCAYHSSVPFVPPPYSASCCCPCSACYDCPFLFLFSNIPSLCTLSS